MALTSGTVKQFVIVACLMLSTTAWGQHGFSTLVPDKPVHLQVESDSLYVTGHWMPVNKDDKKSVMTGPSVSEITCDRKVCNEKQANIVVTGNAFTLIPDYVEYTVEHWNNKEVVASTVVGICRVRLVLKFALVNKQVFWMQYLSD